MTQISNLNWHNGIWVFIYFKNVPFGPNNFFRKNIPSCFLSFADFFYCPFLYHKNAIFHRSNLEKKDAFPDQNAVQENCTPEKKLLL